MAAGERCPVLAAVTLIGRDEADRTVPMLGAVPVGEALDPGSRRLDRREAAGSRASVATRAAQHEPDRAPRQGVKRRVDVVGIFPNEASILRLIGAVLFEQKDEWQTSSRYMLVEAFARIDTEEIDPRLSISTQAA